MIPDTNIRQVATGGVQASVSFGISANDTAHIMRILRSALYTDKVLAVIREYSANAWDAHREVGKKDVPINVHLPTYDEPLLTIRDYGAGLSHDDVFQIFTQYGASTKRNSDVAVGMLGIGSKAGFSYADTFIITSWNGGMKRIYAAVLDPTDKGELKLLSESAGGEETGIEIQIAVKARDVDDFQYKGKKLLKFFHPLPVCNLEIEAPPSKRLTNGEIYQEKNGQWVAIMGCIAYRVNAAQFRTVPSFDAEVFDHLSGSLFFDIGQVNINASREELEYTDATKVAIVAKMNELLDEHVQDVLKEINDGGLDSWNQRLRAQSLVSLKLPKALIEGDVFKTSVVIGEELTPQTFTIKRGSDGTKHIMIKPTSRLVVRDDMRNIKGFQLGADDYLVAPANKATLAEAQAELTLLVEALGLTGIPTALLSTVTWYQPSQKAMAAPAMKLKHRVRTFKLRTDISYYSRPYSGNWLPETERDAEPTDVFVILQEFKTRSTGDFYSVMARDRKIAAAFGLPFPEIYGYKWLTRKPIIHADCVGIEYSEWRKTLFAQIDPVVVDQILTEKAWKSAMAARYHGYNYNHEDLNAKALNRLISQLGDSHPITVFAIQAEEGRKAFDARKVEESVMGYLEREFKNDTEAVVKAQIAAITGRYPMMKIGNAGLPDVWGENNSIWVDYIKMVDSYKETK